MIVGGYAEAYGGYGGGGNWNQQDGGYGAGLDYFLCFATVVFETSTLCGTVN